MPRFFPLFKNNDNIEEGISEEFIKEISSCNHPHIICVYGDARLGKSTKLNQIIHGTNANNYFNLNGPFKTRLEIHTSQTKGCDFYGPIKFRDLAQKNDLDLNEFNDRNIFDDDLFFVDTEGLKSIDNVTRTCVAGILTILQIASIKILYIPVLDNEKLEEAAKNSKLSNILKLFQNESETIVLIRDVPLKDSETVRQIREEIESQKDVFEQKINSFMRKIKAREAICQLLPSYDLAKEDHGGYADGYKEQMQNLVSTVLSKIQNRNNMNGQKLIEIIQELLDIFKQVENIDSMRNTDNALNSILLNTFKQKVRSIFSDISKLISNYDKTIMKLAYKDEEIKKYLIDSIKNALKESWNIYNDSIKNDIDNIIENYTLKIKNEINSVINETKDKINAGANSVLNISNNEEINNFLSRFNFFEEINKNDVGVLINKIIHSFFDKYEKEFECFEENYKNEMKQFLKENIETNLNYRISSMPKRENYLINIFEKIKKEVSNPFVYELINKGKEEIKQNLDLNVLKSKMQIFFASKKIIGINQEDFQNKLNSLYKDIKKTLEERIASIERGEEIEKFKKDKLYGRTIVDGMYLIKLINCQNKVIQIDNNNINVWDFKNENKQKFNIKYDSFHKCYSIQNVENGQFLTCDDNIIFLSGTNNNKNQQWHITISDDYNYEIILEKNNYLMEIAEEKANNGSKVSCGIKSEKPTQRFSFEHTSKTLPPPPPPPPPPKPEPVPIPVRYFPKPNFHGIYNNQISIVDALGSIGVNSSREYRRRIGERNNIPGTPLSESYNLHMLRLLKEGRLIIP